MTYPVADDYDEHHANGAGEETDDANCFCTLAVTGTDPTFQAIFVCNEFPEDLLSRAATVYVFSRQADFSDGVSDDSIFLQSVGRRKDNNLLNFGMWEMSEFWDGGSLSPEWNDNMRTPSGIQTNNILGYNLFNSYFAPVLTKPSFVTLRNIFQNNGGR